MGNLTIWLTPVWILAAGFTAGFAVLLIALGALWLIHRPAAEAALRLVRESVLLWISYLAIVFVVFFFIAIPIMPVKSVLHSLGRLSKVGTFTTSVKVPARTDDKETSDSDE